MVVSMISCNGHEILVDDVDYSKVGKWAWYASKSPQSTENYYAMRSPSGRSIYMHRLILDAPDGITVDHVNGNGLDNRRCNLRLATRSQNNANRYYPPPTSGYRGVYPAGNRFTAIIWKDGKRHTLGRYDCPVEAARIRDRAAKRFFGPFARLNFPEGQA